MTHNCPHCGCQTGAEVLRKNVPIGDGNGWLVKYRDQHFVISTTPRRPATTAFRSSPDGEVTDWDNVTPQRYGVVREQVLDDLTGRPVDDTGHVMSPRDVLDEAERDEEPQHADYPHEPGRLYDCPACEASCHCKPGETECIYDGDHNGQADQEATTVANIARAEDHPDRASYVPDNRPLNDIMEFDHPVHIDPDGTVTDQTLGIYAPELVMETDDDGQILDEHEQDYIEQARRQGWEPLTGWTGQHGYRGPVMHPSEFVGGALADHIHETPGTYVVVAVECDQDSEPAGWVVLRKIEPELRSGS